MKLYSSKKQIVDFVAFHVLILSASLLISVCSRNRVKKVFLLFNFGTETSVISKICIWWWRGGGENHRYLCCVSSFSNCFFSDKR